LKNIIKKEINWKKTKINLTVLVVSSLGALGPKTFGKIRRLAGDVNKQKVSRMLKRMGMAALKGARICW
jgi:DNA-binding HxlR family transcriptional regulator